MLKIGFRTAFESSEDFACLDFAAGSWALENLSLVARGILLSDCQSQGQSRGGLLEAVCGCANFLLFTIDHHAEVKTIPTR